MTSNEDDPNPKSEARSDEDQDLLASNLSNKLAPLCSNWLKRDDRWGEIHQRLAELERCDPDADAVWDVSEQMGHASIQITADI